jgi:hypothetical protein
VHCVGAPLVAGLLPLVGLTLASPRVEWAFLIASLVTSAVTLFRGCLHSHRQWRAVVPFVSGAGCLFIVRIVSDSDGPAAQVAAVVGAALIITSHAFNIRLCRRAGAAECGRPTAMASTASRAFRATRATECD